MTPEQTLCDLGRRAYERGLISGSEGNFSVLLDAQHILCTPAGLCKGRLTTADICLITLNGEQRGGHRRPSSEIQLHLAIYDAARELGRNTHAVVHTHPPFATTFALLNEPVPRGFLPEGEVFLGDVPLVPYHTPGTAAVGRTVRPHVGASVAALLANHGLVSWGPDVETAFLRTEVIESVCRTVYQARLIGTPQKLADAELQELAMLRGRLLAQG